MHNFNLINTQRHNKCSNLTTQVNQALKIVLEQSLTPPKLQIHTADDCDLYLIQSLCWEKIHICKRITPFPSDSTQIYLRDEKS